MSAVVDPHLRWLKRAEHWGEWIRFAEDGEADAVWMMKSTSGPRVRFYAVGRGQIGDEHAHVTAATCWAYASGYLPADAYERNEVMFLALGCRAEVLAGGVADGANGSRAVTA